LAIMTNTIAIDVMNIVIVVELCASSGIFNRALLINIKKSRDKNANPAPTMKCQSRIILMVLRRVKSPLMSARDPVRVMEMTVAREKRMVQKMTASIEFI